MHGILTTLQAGRGSHLMPVSTPNVYGAAEGADAGSLRPHGAGQCLLRAVSRRVRPKRLCHLYKLTRD